jgi:hypothetical protein
VGSTRTPLRKRLISTTEPPKSFGKLLVWRRRAKIEIVVMTLAQRAENGQTLDWWERALENPLASPERFRRRPDG